MNSGWWQNQNPQSLTGATQQPEAQQSPKPVEPGLPQTREELAKFMQEERAKEEHARQVFTEDYVKKLNALSEQFMATEYAPYMPVAMAHFKQVQKANPLLPPQEIYDMTLEYVASMKKMGVAPPPSPSTQSFAGVPSGGQNVPLLGDSRFRGDEQGFRNNIGFYSEEERKQDAENYVNARKRERDYQKSRGDVGQLAKDYYLEIAPK